MVTARRSLLLVALMALGLTACVSPDPTRSRQAALTPLSGKQTLCWGTEVGLRPAGNERLAEGPSAVAAGPGGAVFVLDRLQGRVLRIGSSLAQHHASVAEDLIDLTAAADGALALHSPLRALVQVLDPAGQPAGSLRVPRLFRQVQRVGLGASRQLTLHVAMQETFRLGSPAAPQTLETVLHSKREGAFLLAHRGSAGLAVRRLPDGRPELLVLSNVPGERSRVLQRHALGAPVLAARIVGVAGDVACLLLERKTTASNAALKVHRTAVCLDVTSGREALRVDLPDVGLYLPRRELAVGIAPPRLLLIHPRPRGLRIKVWPLADAQGGAR
jgi:hypothetical protein